MNPIDILGGLLGGNKGGAGGLGAKILKDILIGGAPNVNIRTKPASTPSRQSSPSIPSSSSIPTSGGSVSVSDLEDMLGVGTSRPPATSPTPKPAAPPISSSRPQSNIAPNDDIFGQHTKQAAPADPFAADGPSDISEHDQAIVLIRAMIHAAKADGEIDAAEQQNILERVGDTTPETIQFLRTEFAQATNARDFAWSVPIGMEQPVYTVSLMTINLDSAKEVAYLKELAQGLRLSKTICNQLHQRQGVRAI